MHKRMHIHVPSCPCHSYELKKLHPGGLAKDWLDKLHDQLFFSDHAQHTHEHYLQVKGGAGAAACRGGTCLL